MSGADPFHDIVEHLSVPLVVVRASGGTVRYANPAAEAAFGLAHGALRGPAGLGGAPPHPARRPSRRAQAPRRGAALELLALDAGARVVVSSGYSQDPVMADYQSYGFVDVLPKPFVITQLGEVLRRVLAPAAGGAAPSAADG